MFNLRVIFVLVVVFCAPAAALACTDHVRPVRIIAAIAPQGSVPAPSAPDLAAVSDTGCSQIDNITKATNAAHSIAGVISGATVELLRNGSPVASGVASGTTITLTDTTPPANGVVTYTARQTVGPVTSASGPGSAVIFDSTPPIAIISQAPGQTDPTTVQPIRFAVQFNDTIDAQSFFMMSAGNLLIGSTAATQISRLHIQGEITGTEFVFQYDQFRSPGTVMMSLPVGSFSDYAGNANTVPATGPDNSVSYQPVQFTGSVSGRVRTSSGSLPHPGLVIWMTDAASGLVRIVPINPNGYYKFADIPLWVGVETAVTLEVRRKQRIIRQNRTVFGDNTHPDMVIPY